MLPYGKQTIEADDVQAVVDVLNSDWLTTGPMVERFESAFAAATQSEHAVAVNSGTAALHAAMHAAEIGPGDEVVVPAITFAATANAVVYQEATPVFADVRHESLLVDPDDIARKITPKTKAIVAVDYAGQPCDYDRLRQIADDFELKLIADACHSLGGKYNQRPVGTLADLNCFSFHPVKPITAGEGGVVTTDDPDMARKMFQFRNHGITSDHHRRNRINQHQYDMASLGFNYRLTDIQCALAMSQLGKLDRFRQSREQVALLYENLFHGTDYLTPLTRQVDDNNQHGNHLFVVRWDQQATGLSRDSVFQSLRRNGVGVNVHYRPVYQYSFYRDRFGCIDYRCPVAEQVYRQVLSLPMFPTMTRRDVALVVAWLQTIAERGANLKNMAA